MSYLRFFRISLVVGTLVLVAVWWISLRTWPSTTFESDGLTVSSYIHSGTIGIDASPDSWSEGTSLRFDQTPTSSLKKDFKDRYPPTGRFFFEGPSDHMGLMHDMYFILEFPIWLPWLIIMGATCAWCRAMERRAAGITEKTLASRDRDGRVSGQD